MEKFSLFYYQLTYDEKAEGWYYELYADDFTTRVMPPTEYFANQGIARYAAIGHIHLLESRMGISHSESEHS